MNKLLSIAFFSALFISGICTAQESIKFSAVVRVDESKPHIVQHELGLKEVVIVDLKNEYSLEFKAPDEFTEKARVVIRLLKRDGDEYALLHSSTQNLSKMKVRHVGYQICNEHIVFLSPSPEFPALCNS